MSTATQTYVYRVVSLDSAGRVDGGLLKSRNTALRVRAELVDAPQEFDEVWIERAPQGSWERLP